jgi:thiol-disulfide isomerase/thioredoxin
VTAGGLRAGAHQPCNTMHLAYFRAPWCAVCHEKEPVAEEIAAALPMELARWDIEDPAGRAEADRRRIRTVPTLALIHGDRVPFRLVGRMITPENVRHLLAQASLGPEVGPQ